MAAWKDDSNGWAVELPDIFVECFKHNTLDKLEYGYYSLPQKKEAEQTQTKQLVQIKYRKL